MVSIVPPNNFHWTTFPFFYPCARCFCFPRSNVAATTDRTVIFLQYSILTAHSHKRRVKSKRKRPASLQWHFRGNYTGCFFVCIQSPVSSVGHRDDKLRSYYWIDRKSLCCVLPPRYSGSNGWEGLAGFGLICNRAITCGVEVLKSIYFDASHRDIAMKSNKIMVWQRNFVACNWYGILHILLDQL